MNRKKNIARLVRISPRFRRSTNLEADFGRPEALDGYVVSPLAHEVAIRILEALTSAHSNRAWSLVGPYGSGKSSFATFLSMLVNGGDTSKAALKVYRSLWPNEAKAVRAKLIALGGPLLPVVVTGENIPLTKAIIRGLESAGQRFWTRRKPAIIHDLATAKRKQEKGKKIEDNEFIDLVLRFAQQVVESKSKQSGSGVLLILDEAGKLLEWAAHNPGQSDVYLLQMLAEAAVRFDTGRLGVITVLHQNFDAYAAGLPMAIRMEWAKIEGRFELIPYLESPKHLLNLISGAIQCNEEVKQLPLYKRCAKTIRALDTDRSRFPNFNEVLLAGCFPLHPLTAVSIGTLFRMRIGQNERSLFAFLNSNEQGGFQDYLANTEGSDNSRLYTLDNLYDYLMTNTGVRIIAESGDRTWAAAEQALLRLPKEAEAIDARAVKAIALMSMVAPHVGIALNLDVVANAVDITKAEAKRVVRRLEKASVIVYRKFKNSYQVWDGSDLNVSELLSGSIKRVRSEGGQAERLQKHFPPYPVVASRHYYEKGTLRYLAPRYISATDLLGDLPIGQTGDGDLYYLIPEKKSDLADATRIMKNSLLWKFGRPKAFVIPAQPVELLNAIEEYFSVVDVLENTPELSSDPVARRELDERKLKAQDRLSFAISDSFGASQSQVGIQWYIDGETIQVAGRPSFGASRVFDRAFTKATIVHNELVNRRTLSTAAASARRELLERMMSHETEQRLGIDGNPPELSLYRSILEVTGLHAKVGKDWKLVAPEKKDHFYTSWKMLDEYFNRHLGKQISIERLMLQLAAPPYGMREGISPILLLAYYLVNRSRLFFYEDNVFNPTPTTDVVHRMIKRPDTICIQNADTRGVAKHVIAALTNEIFPNVKKDLPPSLLDVVKAIVAVVTGLSEYASRTQRVSKQAIKVRNAIKSARDPVKLLLKDLPEAVDMSFVSNTEKKADYTGFAKELRARLRELHDADKELRSHIDKTIRNMLGVSADSKSYYSEIQKRCEKLVGSEEIMPSVRRFVDLTAAIKSSDEESLRTWLEGIGVVVVGKPPSHWTDNDVTHFSYGALELCRNFIATEDLLFETSRDASNTVRLIRVSVLDSYGVEKSGVAVLREESAEKVQAFEAQTTKLAVSLGIDTPELAYAVISSMIEKLSDKKEIQKVVS